MKRPAMLLLALMALPLIGCDDDKNVLVEKDQVPAAPQGVYSVTGDHSVVVHWNGIYETDVASYRVYRSLDSINGYASIVSVAARPNSKLDLLLYSYDDNTAVNGTTYWYAVTAVDNAGQESDLSAEGVYDTPRPEGNALIYPYEVDSTHASFSLALGQVVNWGAGSADIYADRVNGIYYLNAANDMTDIQDVGFTKYWQDIGWAPDSGWVALGYCEAIPGHTYVIWTNDYHYAKVRITSISVSGAIAFQWAWQSVQDNLELAPPVRPSHTEEFGQPKRTIAGQLIK